MTAPVVVAVDGTEDGRRALRYGVALAIAYDAPLRLVHVRHQNVTLAPMLPLFPDPTLVEIAQHVLDAAVHEATELGWAGPEPEKVLGDGPRVPAILDASRGGLCVVLGIRSSRHHLATGSTTHRVAAHADVPVLCIPERSDPDAEFHRVVVGSDCTAASAQAIDIAAAAAGRLGAELVVLHAWRPVGQYDAAIGARTFAQRWETETRPFLDDLVEPVRARHPELKISIELQYEKPAVALHAASSASDLVVIGQHGRHARYGMLLGSTARTLLRTSDCPVMVVPTPPAV